MQTAVDTSPLLAHRAEEVVPKRMLAMEAAYTAKDFSTFATLTLQACAAVKAQRRRLVVVCVCSMWYVVGM